MYFVYEDTSRRDVLYMELPQMQIYEFIDICFNNKDKLTDELRYQIPNEYNEKQWVDVCMFFLSNLSKRHNISGKIVDTLIGIGVWHKNNKPLTREQMIYLTSNLIDYWDQLDPETFIQLNL